MHCE